MEPVFFPTYAKAISFYVFFFSICGVVFLIHIHINIKQNLTLSLMCWLYTINPQVYVIIINKIDVDATVLNQFYLNFI